ncbi:MAG: hypothetical protein IJA73_04885, partial [Oscillospiraceae bacterium]|nr:hypothetical protein [Oscillospiraceae bacterium]
EAEWNIAAILLTAGSLLISLAAVADKLLKSLGSGAGDWFALILLLVLSLAALSVLVGIRKRHLRLIRKREYYTLVISVLENSFIKEEADNVQ